jgi:hypothetical protein
MYLKIKKKERERKEIIEKRLFSLAACFASRRRFLIGS